MRGIFEQSALKIRANDQRLIVFVVLSDIALAASLAN